MAVLDRSATPRAKQLGEFEADPLRSRTVKQLCLATHKYLTNVMELHPLTSPTLSFSDYSGSFTSPLSPHRTHLAFSTLMPSNAFNPSGHNYGQRSTTTHHSPPQSNDEVLQWLDALSAQEHGLDPRIYSDGRMPQIPHQYYAGGYPSGGYPPGSMPPGPYPSPSYFHNAAYQSATNPQLPAGSYSPAYPAGTYALAPQQGSSMQPYVSHQQQFPHAAPHQYPQQQHPQQHQQPYSPSFDPAFAEELDDYSATESEGIVEAGGSRARSRIPLDASQPLTVEGRMRERVNVACDRWCVSGISSRFHLRNTQFSLTANTLFPL